MKNLKFINLAVFIIFFGIALLEAFQQHHWLEAALFLALGILSLLADIGKKPYLLIAIVAVAAAASGVFYLKGKQTQIACTLEAKLCPGGSSVGRVGPKCEFAPCPQVTAMGTIKGKVTVGPICPVERVGVPCPVPPEAYTSREVILYDASGTTVVKRMHFSPDGTYLFEVPVGVYVLASPRQGIGGSKELPQTVSVKSGETLEVNFSIDTGIR